MKPKNGSTGFDFRGTYTHVVKHQLIESGFGENTLGVEFAELNRVVAAVNHIDGLVDDAPRTSISSNLPQPHSNLWT